MDAYCAGYSALSVSPYTTTDGANTFEVEMLRQQGEAARQRRAVDGGHEPRRATVVFGGDLDEPGLMEVPHRARTMEDVRGGLEDRVAYADEGARTLVREGTYDENGSFVPLGEESTEVIVLTRRGTWQRFLGWQKRRFSELREFVRKRADSGTTGSPQAWKRSFPISRRFSRASPQAGVSSATQAERPVEPEIDPPAYEAIAQGEKDSVNDSHAGPLAQRYYDLDEVDDRGEIPILIPCNLWREAPKENECCRPLTEADQLGDDIRELIFECVALGLVGVANGVGAYTP